MILLILFATLLWIFYKYYISSFAHWKRRGICFVNPMFPFGNIYPLVRMQKWYGNLLAQLYSSTTEDVVGYWIFNMPYLLIRSPKLINNILVEDFNQFSDRAVSVCSGSCMFNDMLYSLKEHEWKVLRSKLSLAFTESKLKRMTYIFNQSSGDLTEYLNQLTENEVDCKDISKKFAVNVYTTYIFGDKINSFEDANCEFLLYAERISRPTIATAIRLLSIFIVPKLAKLFQFQIIDYRTEKYFQQKFQKILQERIASGVECGDFIDTCVQLKNEGDLDDDKLLAQAVQFYIAGCETTTSIMAFILYELALNVSIQDKLRLELIDALKQENGDTFSYETIQKLAYLDKVMLEAWRKYPTLPLIERKCNNDYKIPGTELIIEKGTKCHISPVGLHYDPKYFPNPEIFDPERFSTKNKESMPDYVYMPFGAGPRNCIGNTIGVLPAKICLAKILTNYRVEATSNTPKRIEIDAKVLLIKPKAIRIKFNQL